MAVDTTIPSSSNNVGNDLSAIRENFELLASAQVVDEGSTADGDYIRYENGWQIIVATQEIPESEIDDYSGNGSILPTFDFPVDFVTKPDFAYGDGITNTVTGSTRRPPIKVYWGRWFDDDSTAEDIINYNNTEYKGRAFIMKDDDLWAGQTFPIKFRFLFIGRWK